MKDFGGKLAVVTGGGSGIGKQLVLQLVSEGCDVAICDVSMENMQETQRACNQQAAQGAKTSIYLCDVSDEAAVNGFADEVLREHNRDHINLLFNNAGIGGGGSFIIDDRDGWDKTFDICWFGVYNCCRAFMPLMIKADAAHLINISSVNGFWATIGPTTAHTAYSAAKFAVKGFSEALVNDLRLNAPHVEVSVVMPGHVATSLVENSNKIMSGVSVEELTAEDFSQMRERLRPSLGDAVDDDSDEDLRAMIIQRAASFQEDGLTSAAEAAEIILTGVKESNWRILVGQDAHVLDELVRQSPKEAYEESFIDKLKSKTTWKLGDIVAGTND
jgi:NAD(P)-dependent dehydrogenase (short-subunit alcohol dehydrogenase family)